MGRQPVKLALRRSGSSGSEAEAKRRGVLRTEGRAYVVQDGGVLHILFNV